MGIAIFDPRAGGREGDEMEKLVVAPSLVPYFSPDSPAADFGQNPVHRQAAISCAGVALLGFAGCAALDSDRRSGGDDAADELVRDPGGTEISGSLKAPALLVGRRFFTIGMLGSHFF